MIVRSTTPKLDLAGGFVGGPDSLKDVGCFGTVSDFVCFLGPAFQFLKQLVVALPAPGDNERVIVQGFCCAVWFAGISGLASSGKSTSRAERKAGQCLQKRFTHKLVL